MDRILHILNPTGQGGAGARAWDAYVPACGDAVDTSQLAVTERPGHARELAAGAVDVDVVVAVGGDGTVGEVMSGLMDRPEPRPLLGIVPAGTGNDIARDLGIRSVTDAVAALRTPRARPVDLVRADLTRDGQPFHQYGYLFGLVGFSATPMLKPWMKRFLGAAGAYYLATLLQYLVYQPPRMTVRVDGQAFEGRFWMVIVGNAERSGGGSMRLAPGARTDDGLGDVTIMEARAKPRMLVDLLPKIPAGEHVGAPGVHYLPGRTIAVTTSPPVIVDLDGDAVGTTPVTFTVVEHALRAMAPV
jgi:YegS/Rv2252/BmrU family lipid kinase